MRYSIAICLAAAAVAACSNPVSNNAAAANGAANTAAPAPDPAPPPAANTVAGNNVVAAAAASHFARGFEPGWALTVAGGQLSYQSQNGPNFTIAAPAKVIVGSGFKFDAPGQITAIFTPGSCTEASGQVDSHTVQVHVAGQTLNGCGQ